MLKDYTDEIIKTASRYKPQQRKVLDIQGIGDALKSMQTNFRVQDLASALESGDAEAINKARSALDPTGYANFLDQQAQRAEDRQWALEDADRKYQQAVALENIHNQNARNLAEFKASLGSQGTTAMRNMEYLVSQGYTPQEAAALYYGGQNSTLNLANLGQKGQEAYDKEVGKYLAEEATANKQMQTLKPKAENAIRRAREALNQGEGLGQIGGKFWTTGQGGKNRANIKNAQAQINTAMRGLLKQMGVGSTELNSAVEAEAYRYQIAPDMPIAQQEQVLNNFVEDYMSGALAKDLQEIYGKKQSLKDFQTKDWSNASNEDLLKGL